MSCKAIVIFKLTKGEKHKDYHIIYWTFFICNILVCFLW